MNVWNGLDRVPSEHEPLVATIGNYDGVHLGHREILRRAVADARRRASRSVLVTFEPHPLEVVAPERRPKRIHTRRQKLETLAETGLDAVLFLPFDAPLAALDGRSFFATVLAGKLPLAAIHVGTNFRFGRGRSGDLELLTSIGTESGFEVHGVPPVTLDGETVSSSAIRRLVETGDVERARRMLGSPFGVEGIVARGQGRGRTLRFPTANLAVENELLPRPGVYVTESRVLGGRFPSVTNVGTRPTFDGSALTVESHLLDFEDDLYGERASVLFLARLRDERRFESPDALADQIARDRAAAVAYFQGATVAP